MAAANATACRHLFVAVGVDSDEGCHLAFPDCNRYNGGVFPDRLPVWHVRAAARVASDLQVLLHMVFLNASACAGKEVNAKVTEIDALPVRVVLKNAARSNVARTDRSI